MKSAAAPAQPPPAAPKQGRSGATILVVEDECFVRDVTCETLRNAGYRVLQSECAASGRKMFLRYRKRIRVLLCDAVLPDSSGVVFSQTLCRLSPGLQVILASGYPTCGWGEKFNQEARTEFLAKPYGAAALISRVQLALQRERSGKRKTHIRGR